MGLVSDTKRGVRLQNAVNRSSCLIHMKNQHNKNLSASKVVKIESDSFIQASGEDDFPNDESSFRKRKRGKRLHEEEYLADTVKEVTIV